MPDTDLEDTLTRKAVKIVRDRWSMRFKIWFGVLAASISFFVSVFAGSQWINQNVAWAADVERALLVQQIDVHQINTEDRMWKVKHELKQIETRRLQSQPLLTDSGDETLLLAEYGFLLTQKAKWNAAEKEVKAP